MTTWCKKCGRKQSNPVESRLQTCFECDMAARNATVPETIHVAKDGTVTKGAKAAKIVAAHSVTPTIRERKGDTMATAKQVKATQDAPEYVIIGGVAYPKATTAQVKTVKLPDTKPSYLLAGQYMHTARALVTICEAIGVKVQGKPNKWTPSSKWAIDANKNGVTLVCTRDGKA